MITLTLTQGTELWLKTRLENFTASEAPAMMGDSKYMSRNELLDIKKSGIAKPVNKFTQKIFDKGHATEEAARPLVEYMIEDDLYPVTGLLEDSNLLASFDGLTMMQDIVFEHKLFNETLAENVRNNVLEPHYFWQLEQQLLVSGAEKVIFVTSDGTKENFENMWYVSVPERRAQLIAGWKQFAIDLANHEVKAKVEKVVANDLQALPKLEISLMGSVNNSNLAEYKGTALAFIKSVNTELCSDQDFVDADKAVKFFSNGEKELEAVKERALSDTADIKALFDTIDELKEEMRQKRLTLSKLVKSRKDEIKNEIMVKAGSQVDALVNDLRAELNINTIDVESNFAEVVKNKRTVESLQNAVDSELARCKIELNEQATVIRANLSTLEELASDYQFLFNDWQILVTTKANEDLTNLIKSRIAEHKAAEAARLEAQREQVRLEEEAKAQAKVEAEAARNAQIIENDRLLKEREANNEKENQEEQPAQQANIDDAQEKPVAQRLAGRFADTSEQELNDVINKAVNVNPALPKPTCDDMEAFLKNPSKEMINHFCFLLLDDDPENNNTARNEIKAAFANFMQQAAA